MNRTSGAGTRRPPGEAIGVGSGRRRVGDRGAFMRPAEEPRAPLPTRVSDTSPLPESSRALLVAGLDRLGLAGFAPDVVLALEGHLRLLLAWTRAVNLTAIREPEAAVRGHVLDSLAAVAVLRAHGVDELLDLGSGGGYPGLPLALALPARRALLVDSIAKKTVFLDTVIAAIGAADRVSTATARAESLAVDPAQRERWPAVVARAVAELADLAELALPLVRVGGLLVAWKREPLDDELASVRRVLAALGAATPRVEPVPVPGLEAHRLVILEKVRPTPARFPREPAARARARDARRDVRAPAS